MLHRNRFIPWLVLFTAGLAGGCSSTKIVSTWKDPTFQGPIDFKRTLVIAIVPDKYSRKVCEDAIVERIGEGRAVAGYHFLTDDQRQDGMKLTYQVGQGHVDGIITMGVVGVTGRTARDIEAGTVEPFYDYYDKSNAFIMNNSELSSESVYRVETRIYDVKSNRLIWRALSDIVNPQSDHEATVEIAKAVGAELRKQKLLK